MVCLIIKFTSLVFRCSVWDVSQQLPNGFIGDSYSPAVHVTANKLFPTHNQQLWSTKSNIKTMKYFRHLYFLQLTKSRQCASYQLSMECFQSTNSKFRHEVTAKLLIKNLNAKVSTKDIFLSLNNISVKWDSNNWRMADKSGLEMN